MKNVTTTLNVISYHLVNNLQKKLWIMKKRVILTFASILLCTLALVGCKKNSPSAYIDKLYTATINKDYRTMVEMMPDSEGKSEEEKQGIIEMMQLADEFTGGVKDYKIISEQISKDGKHAVVKVRVTFGTGEMIEETAELVMSDKGWIPDPEQYGTDTDDEEEFDLDEWNELMGLDSIDESLEE